MADSTSKLVVISVADGAVSANNKYDGTTGIANITLKAAATINNDTGVLLEWIPEDDRQDPVKLADGVAKIYVVVDPATVVRASATNGVTVTADGKDIEGESSSPKQIIFTVDGSVSVFTTQAKA